MGKLVAIFLATLGAGSALAQSTDQDIAALIAEQSRRAPERVNVTGDLPLNLGRDEKIIYVFADTTYFTMRSKTQYVGGSHGVSFRVMKGVY